VEALNRGLVAFRTSENNVFISWRLLGTDAEGTAFNLYRSLDGKPVIKRSVGAPEGNFTLKPGSQKQYLSIPLRTPERYTAGDCSTGDLDGDGEYEIVVHMVGVGRDNSHGALLLNSRPPTKQFYIFAIQ